MRAVTLPNHFGGPPSSSSSSWSSKPPPCTTAVRNGKLRPRIVSLWCQIRKSRGEETKQREGKKTLLQSSRIYAFPPPRLLLATYPTAGWTLTHSRTCRYIENKKQKEKRRKKKKKQRETTGATIVKRWRLRQKATLDKKWAKKLVGKAELVIVGGRHVCVDPPKEPETHIEKSHNTYYSIFIQIYMYVCYI